MLKLLDAKYCKFPFDNLLGNIPYDFILKGKTYSNTISKKKNRRVNYTLFMYKFLKSHFPSLLCLKYTLFLFIIMKFLQFSSSVYIYFFKEACYNLFFTLGDFILHFFLTKIPFINLGTY